MAILAVVVASALMACSKKNAPGQTQTTSGSAEKLASSVVVDVDPKVGFAGDAAVIPLDGPAFLTVREQSGSYQYVLQFFPRGSNPTCDTELALLGPLPGNGPALRVEARSDSAPKGTVTLDAADLDLHFSLKGRHSTSGIFKGGAKLKLANVGPKIATGEITGKTGSSRVAGAHGTFNATVCSTSQEKETSDDTKN
jgi:hypothetical protein